MRHLRAHRSVAPQNPFACRLSPESIGAAASDLCE